ncbi:hypothetical protein ACKWTF_015087 [Chironomus riparius]
MYINYVKPYPTPKPFIPRSSQIQSIFTAKNYFKWLTIMIVIWIFTYVVIIAKHSKSIESEIQNENKLIDRLQTKLSEIMKGGTDMKSSFIDQWNYKNPKNSYNLSDGISEIARKYIKLFNLTNPGHLGVPVRIPKNQPKEIELLIGQSYNDYGFNQFISSMVSLNRELPDVRTDGCKQKVYRTDKFSKVSVIIPFYNDDWTILMRTVHSIIRMTPLEYILEILLVDDCSTMEHLKEPLEKYTATLPVTVRIIRSHTRLGIVANRVLGARNARAPVLIYIDSHIEVFTGWFEPIMDRFVDNMDLIVLPNVSKIWSDGMDIDYMHNAGKIMAIDWQLHENFVDMAWFEGNHSTPADDPKIAPIGIFAVLAIGRKFYERIGYLDIDMDIWGGEDYELIFRTWLCGGRVEFVPCSHIAHMYRQHRYSERSKGKGGYRWNMDRLVETWMDDYKQYYYAGIEKHNIVYGDLTERLELKKKLKCKPFKWYIDNVFPRLNEIPKNLH